ncbi:MAG: hypothetical protein IKR07_05100 [Oscillospiraceae bacterium]|nr:hypothetical protein [Oscillospiraceae bacterium]
MTAFGMLPVTVQNAVCFGALLSCFVCLADGILFWREARRVPFLLTALDFLCAYVLVHLCRELTETRLHGGTAAQAASVFSSIPWLVPLAALGLLLAGAIALYAYSRRWRSSHITADSIRESMDGLPAGVCYYLEEGRCILVNHRMHDVCRALTGRDLQNGAAFFEAVKGDGVRLLPDGTAVRFRHRRFVYENAPLHELIADDVTEIYRKSEQLRSDNERARQLSEDMKAYGFNIGETVRRQEILEAKIHIHDEMNGLLLAAQRSLQAGTADADRAEVLRLWRSQMLLLRKAADRHPDVGVVADLETLAGVIGIELFWDGKPDTEDTDALRLFLLATREAMANAVRHAGAKRLFIRVRGDSTAILADYSNDGDPPAGEVRETGGLANLREKVSLVGGEMCVETDTQFRLRIRIPLGGD